jgi:type II secretory pathway pseudopilin PulG
LFEVILTIAILSLGLVFVVRSLSLSMRVAKAALNYNQAINLAYEKMFDLELQSRVYGLEPSFEEGDYPLAPYFSWKYSVEPLGDGLLNYGMSPGKKEREKAGSVLIPISV